MACNNTTSLTIELFYENRCSMSNVYRKYRGIYNPDTRPSESNIQRMVAKNHRGKNIVVAVVNKQIIIRASVVDKPKMSLIVTLKVIKFDE